MTAYNSEIAREIYQELMQDDSKEYPITALVVNGILDNFVYWTHESYPNWIGETMHVEVKWKDLLKDSWQKVKASVQKALDKQTEQIAA